MKNFRILAATLATLTTLSGAALAQTSVSATTDLNVRSGPGPQYSIIGMIGAGQATTLNGCLKDSKWCVVATSAGDGWVYSDYLIGDFDGQQVVLTQRPTGAKVQLIPAPDNKAGEGAVVGGVTGAIAGALIAGPVGAAIGGAVGATAGGATGAAIDPPANVRTYVTTNTVAPVYLDGEVVVGAGLPESIELREIPEYEYRYVYVNGQPVLVDAKTRQIVYIVR